MSEHEDLEDGEIEDDDEDDVLVLPVEEEEVVPLVSVPAQPLEDWDEDEQLHAPSDKVEIAEKISDVKARRNDKTTPPKNLKRSKPAPVVDDWATSVENAIASALKKDGVQPPMPSINNRYDDTDGETPAKRKKRDKHKKKPIPEKTEEMEEIDLEYEMMNVRGGSPRPAQHADRSDSADSYSSDDSRERERERDRERRDRDRDREYSRRKRKNRPRNRGNRENRKRKRDDSDDEKHNGRHSGPRKMELCKFYLMDCCAKREKCLYMHSDFPCKYYYLGLKCKDKEKCLFSHGEPLSDELRVILLKHLETAPQEILGDFPRISRESANTMINATHRKLLEKFGMTEKMGSNDNSGGGKIPSLLDMIGSSDRGSSKNRRSRWCEKNTADSLEESGKSSGSPNGDVLSLKHLNGVISQEQIANLEQMGIHNLDQINQLTVAQLNELGLSIGQIHELQLNSLNMKKLRDIAKLGNKSDDLEFPESTSALSLTNSNKDLDMRITPSHTSLQEDSSETHTLGGKDVDMRFLPMVSKAAQEATTGKIPNTQEDNLDLVSSSLTNLIKTPTVDYSQYLKDSNLNDDDDMDNTENTDNLLIAHDDEDDDDDDEENNLKISIEDEEPVEKNHICTDNWDSDDEPLLPKPAIFDTKLVNRSVTQKIDYSKPFGMYKPAEDEPEKCIDSFSQIRFGNSSEQTKKKVDIFSRKSMYNASVNASENTGSKSPSTNKQQEPSANSGQTMGWTPNSSTTPGPTATKTVSQPSKPPRPSIYDDPCNSEISDDSDSESKSSMYTDRDKDMRLGFLNLDAKMGEEGNSFIDVDLRLPFKPIMTNYIPATEIDGSITSHPPIVYKITEVDIPKPNYKDIRRNTPRPERTKDPRLRRIFGISNEDNSDSNSYRVDSFIPGIRSPPSAPPLAAPVVSAGPVVPRIDPRTKRNQEIKAQGSERNSANTRTGNPVQLDVQTILQRSAWYTDLSSKHKIMVNQQLAILTTEMKKFHSSDKSPDLLADFMQLLAGNQMLQFILTNLNVYVDDSVAFCEVPLVPAKPPPLMSVSPPNLGLPPMGMMPPVGIPPPITKPPSLFDLPRFNCPPEVRPGLLGVAPNMPFEQFLAMGQVTKNNNPPPLLEEWIDDYDDGLGGLGGGGGFTPNYEQNMGNFNNMRNNAMRNNRIGNNNFRNNERWNNSRGGGGNSQNRRNNNNRRNVDKKK
ncbi:protein suppressor of sable-like [Topomyia yanbarensis]|uniref:protein suppressor of sable-like n=1 Tax=Topomyia yanbarensis TaxID=2498891 RepID=UPI00273C7AC0|nr:protein suppressor of sable-like [Topomyia yanbarensis]XP_058836129.1 protein suppressor of sable-like [Topomyia yanbarensis]